MATSLPYVVFTNITSFLGLTPMLSSNFQAINQALGERLTAHRQSVERYAATGATTTKIPLGSRSPKGSTPWAVILVRARETSDPAKDLSVTPRLNYAQEGDTLFVYEPAGLSTNTFYDLDFVVLE